MSHKIDTYTELQQQIHNDLRVQHPEWIGPDGDCPTCDSYESQLVQLLERLANRIRPAKNASAREHRWNAITQHHSAAQG